MSTQAINGTTSCVVPRRVATVREEAAKRFEYDLIGVLHGELHGVAAALSGQRSPNYFRQQLRGEHPITLADLAGLATHPAREARDAVRAFAMALLDRIRPHDGVEALEDAAAAFTREAADVPAVVLSAIRDGRLTHDEVAEITREITEAGTGLDRVRAALPQEVRS